VPAPTLLELKKHAQSLCLLISTLECSDLDNEKGNGLPPLGKGAFDFLDDPYVPYENDRPFCNQPLTSLVNTMPSQHIPSTAESLPECRILDNAEGTGDVEDLVGHVNECLEEIDHAFSPRGGLLALLPPETMDVKGDSEKNVFGQWLHYTQTLVRRVAELERDVVLLREILGSGEMVVPGVIAIDPKAGCGLGERAGRVVVAQDRYVLAGLNERL